jgi:hypothetical protein
MSNQLSPELLYQLFSQNSNDPYLTLLTLTHTSFSQPIRLVNNVDSITSRGNVFQAFPMKITLPMDDGETSREVAVEFDNVSLALVESIRTVTTPIEVKLEMVLASIPDAVQYSLEELKIGQIEYNSKIVRGKLYMDNFLATSLTSESYTPTSFSGIF